VVVVDGHDLIRAGISSLIASDPDYEVVGEASDAAQAIDVVNRLAPDVVLMDVSLPDISGIEATRRMCNPSLGTAVVLFSTECDTEMLMAALRAGAHGFVLKDVERGELLSVIRRVLTGSHAIEATLATELLRHMAEDVAQRPASRPEPLTPREVEVLRLISTGSTNRQIASRLIVAVGTVKVHVEHIMAKLGAADRTQAAVLAIEMGLINPESSGERDQNLS
jgi:DNA-binding NarL/FixJ family response regulator